MFLKTGLNRDISLIIMIGYSGCALSVLTLMVFGRWASLSRVQALGFSPLKIANRRCSSSCLLAYWVSRSFPFVSGRCTAAERAGLCSRIHLDRKYWLAWQNASGSVSALSPKLPDQSSFCANSVGIECPSWESYCCRACWKAVTSWRRVWRLLSPSLSTLGSVLC